MTDVAGSSACYNCGTPLTGPFCASCGQKARPLDPTVHDFLHDFSHEMLHVDGRIFRSIRKLLISPGFLTREQFQGRRAHWISPIRLYLIFSLAYFAISSFAAARALPPLTTPDNDPDTIFGMQLLGFDSEHAFREAVAEATAHWGPRAMFVLVPVLAWLVGYAWRRGQRNYPQHLYCALHVHAAWFAIAALIVLVGLRAPSSVRENLDTIPMVYGFVYVVLTFRVAYGGTVGQSIVRAAAVLVAYYLVVALVAVAIALAVILGQGRAAETAFQTSPAITFASRALVEVGVQEHRCERERLDRAIADPPGRSKIAGR